MTRQGLINEQVQFQELIQQKLHLTLVTCGNCGAPFMHKMGLETLFCYKCQHELDVSDCPDLFFKGMHISEEENQTPSIGELDRSYFWTERPTIVVNELKKFFEKVTNETYINDDTPTLKVNDLYFVYLPNSIHCDEINNQTNRYAIIRVSERLEDKNECYRFANNLNEAINTINELIDDDKLIKKSEVQHRIRMIMDDLTVIRGELSDALMKVRTTHADDLYVHFANVAIACDLDNDESLSWKLYKNGAKND